jgi:hypothetical protein
MAKRNGISGTGPAMLTYKSVASFSGIVEQDYNTLDKDS